MFLAHAFGSRYELPIPLLLFVLGGALVVIASFLLVFRQGVERGPDSPLPDETYLQPVRPLRTGVSITVLALLVAAGLAGSQDVPENILPTAFWVLIWVAVPLSCGLYYWARTGRRDTSCPGRWWSPRSRRPKSCSCAVPSSMPSAGTTARSPPCW